MKVILEEFRKTIGMNAEGLVAVIEQASAMDADEVSRMRQAGRDFYERFLEPKAFAEECADPMAGKFL